MLHQINFNDEKVYKLETNEFFEKLKENNIDTAKVQNNINDIIRKTII